MSKPISLTDQQLNTLLAAARPLQPVDRSAFLAAVANHFAGRAEVGDGELGRAIRELQCVYFRTPTRQEINHNGTRPLDRLRQ